mgnify:CR=1 FL=1
MISYVKGELAEIQDGKIVVDTGGIGVEILVPSSVMGSLPRVGEEVKIYTYFRVSEDAMTLYGFNCGRDRTMFEQLISLSGIGPKGALAILGTLSPDDLRMAIMSGDSKAISQAPGIGVKTAQRVIIDLKDKIGLEDILGVSTQNTNINVTSGNAQEAVEALVSLGYSPTTAARAVRSVEGAEDMDTEDILKTALKFM